MYGLASRLCHSLLGLLISTQGVLKRKSLCMAECHKSSQLEVFVRRATITEKLTLAAGAQGNFLRKTAVSVIVLLLAKGFDCHPVTNISEMFLMLKRSLIISISEKEKSSQET